MSTQVYNRTIASTYEYDATATGYSGTWGPVTLTITQTNGGTPPIQGAEITIYYLLSATNLGTTISTTGLAYTGFVSCATYPGANAVSTNSFTLACCDQASGAYLYVWLSHDICYQPIGVTMAATGPAASGTTSGGATFGNYSGGTPNFTPSSGTLAVDTSNNTLWTYTNGTWSALV